jgi:chitosanase
MRANPQRGLSPQQRLRSEQLISLFENSTIEFQYSYAKVLGDGRGVTAGRAGFTTGTGDAYIVVQQYTNKVPNNPLAKYLPELKRLLTAENRNDTSKLRGLIEAWQSAAKDPLFRSSQDRIMEQMYYLPSLVHANRQGLNFALSRAVLYDTIIQHGNGNDPDSLSALLKETQQRVGGTPQTGVDEREWLRNFLAIRRWHLSKAHNPATRKVWAESVTRVDVWSSIASSENYNLKGPIPIRVSYYNTTIP